MRKTRRKSRRQKGGRAGTLKRILYLDESHIIGAGGYGIAVVSHNKKEIFKLLYDTRACATLKHEAAIHNKAYHIFPNIIPRITYFSAAPIEFQGTQYLCGIGMEHIQPPLDFDEAVHIILGYAGDDLDSSWGRTTARPVGPENPTRGFFASPETMEWIWAQEGSSMTIEKLAAIMGATYRGLLEAGILPIDLEWIWSRGCPYLIDFGLCEEGRAEPVEFLKKQGLRGLADDIYIPHEGDRGYHDFIREYLGTK